MTMKKVELLMAGLLVTLAFASAPDPASARLPAPPETAGSKAKAEEVAAKVAAAARKEADELARYQDKAVANYKERQAK
jgi:hypothetical protein